MISGSKQKETTPQGLQILVVEDEQDTARAVQRFLEFRGHTVRIAEQASTAICMADDSPPEILVCDFKLGGHQDGVDVARKVLARHHIPVIMVTGQRLAQVRQRARESAVKIAAFRRKPVSLADLASLIESLGVGTQSA